MHRELAAERGELVGLAGEFQRDEHAHLAGAVDHGAVDVARHHALPDRERGRAAQRHVLADGGDRVRRSRSRRSTLPTLAALIFSTSAPTSSATCAIILTRPWNWPLRATKSVSELTSTTTPLLPVGQRADQAFGRDAAGLLRSL